MLRSTGRADFKLTHGCVRCRGINRLTHNFELALPIIDDAFRYAARSFLRYRISLTRIQGLRRGSRGDVALPSAKRRALPRLEQRVQCGRMHKAGQEDGLEQRPTSCHDSVSRLCVAPCGILTLRIDVIQGRDTTQSSGKSSINPLSENPRTDPSHKERRLPR